ncbi:hypothetical protein BDV33DRAFT_184411 [Aspergillus novoparasiticus]|uniref:Uncharacterized protein n=1 Tax=Aspergillus novoparasiticus TaxID=986946 RepID=A0A5N6EA01_9EURO|nr:hypothetical protein BDV33DRAFT_184411 [Aspergillus novoparasiticus]
MQLCAISTPRRSWLFTPTACSCLLCWSPFFTSILTVMIALWFWKGLLKIATLGERWIQ